MELLEQLVSCGFKKEEALLITGSFLSGISVAMEQMGATTTKTVRKVLTEGQVREILSKSIDEYAAPLSTSERARIDDARRAFEEMI